MFLLVKRNIVGSSLWNCFWWRYLAAYCTKFRCKV